ncbi:hypothetical protein JCM5296_003257 [Sporobolomyces johnsonii]
MDTRWYDSDASVEAEERRIEDHDETRPENLPSDHGREYAVVATSFSSEFFLLSLPHNLQRPSAGPFAASHRQQLQAA